MTCDLQTASVFITEIIAVSDSITAPDAQPTCVTETELTAGVARTVTFITEVRTVELAIAAASHVNARTTSTRKLLLTARCLYIIQRRDEDTGIETSSLNSNSSH